MDLGWLAWVERALLKVSETCERKVKEEKANHRRKERSEREEVVHL